ncbi:hypothetical protein vB_PsyM_KIL4_0027 [Pseudomonas phage vB_PsyM_KIL4]|uniref:DNA binding protein n=3 Tax=Flaumdravirus TaxID=2560133 RepID=A0A142IEV5_9CAUD|nr:HNH endonuclease [Pseudomonas phage vB_PsyM_KIL1]YP_009616713.1 HNH endonuclease [Pseudomonas phage vB_PsyM_KIL4]AMR57277.1 putative DNA binding protein [Pseudomonas phage vB_PsyM_KIL1]AMR57760.1 hypothetical protein vB_PsyM_KIL4_0027 [Pseudomonas phage vB_PsyM_KIL4]AMR57927.1 hypothetical protein vB_PsyM_KIL5_0027 [Pseudomonas phage vB_PsyM_KIL5]
MKKAKLICGVGINDADYPVTSRADGKYWKCPFYSAWKGMIERGYSAYTKDRRPTYKDKYVCNEWLVFSNFKAWMETQDWEGKQLDKDLLVPGNKVYSPETCVFVSPLVNTFLTESTASRGEWPIGVWLHTQCGKFQAKCSNPFTKKSEHLGLFENPHDANKAWLARKLELAFRLAEMQTDAKIARLLIKRYSEYGS